MEAAAPARPDRAFEREYRLAHEKGRLLDLARVVIHSNEFQQLTEPESRQQYVELEIAKEASRFLSPETYDVDAVVFEVARVAMAEAGPEITTAAAGPQERPWPTWDPAVLHGVAGAYVKLLTPETEADPIGLLGHFLVYFGNAAGRSVHVRIGATDHYLNEFIVTAGDSSTARKGTANDHVRRSYVRIDSGWADSRIQEGLQSGEGVIWAVRDAIEKREPIKEKGHFTGEYNVYESDPGIADKRLLVVESEFARVLKVCGRETNTLSATIRQSWDSGMLRILNKNSPASATGAHISIVGHVTIEELLHSFDTLEAASGFGNRFLWLAVRRSGFLPFGGKLLDIELEPYEQKVKKALEFVRRGGEFEFNRDAAHLWERIYPDLSEGRPGLLGSILARCAPHTRRIACIYAALDCTLSIRPDHLEAAIALWDYAKASAEYIFGSKLGDPDSDAIMTALRANPSGLTRTQINHDVFSRNLSNERLDRALSTLLRHHLAKVEQRQTGGRPAEVWVLARPEDKQ